MSNPDDDRRVESTNRRRLLGFLGAGAATSLAGCLGGDDGGNGDESEPTENETSENETSEDETSETDDSDETEQVGYPYGANQNLVGEAQAVMEEAGYGEDNRFELNWLQYSSPTWKEMANTIRARLESAYIDMNITEAGFSELLNKTAQGEPDCFTLGWIADYPGKQNFTQLVDPDNTVYDAEGTSPNGARLFWSEDANADTELRNTIADQFAQISGNPGSSDSAVNTRNEAALRLEEALWDSAAMLPIYHRTDDAFWYDRVDYNPAGALGGSRSKAINGVAGVEGSDTLSGTSSTFNSLDPIASGNTASGGKIMNMFDAPFNYVNGTTETAPLIIQDFTASDDLTEYEFTLKEGIQFHGDYGEVTADDVVYSIRRLVESTNSTNTYFPNSVLNIEREEEEVETEDGETVTRAVPGTVGVEATGDYTFTMTLREAFGFTIDVLAYSAFSVIPEGIVGDIEGYDGDMSFNEFSTNPIGCGPYTFEQWDSGNGGTFRASAFEDYHGGDVPVANLESAILTEPTARYNRFVNGNADVSGIPTSQYDPEKVNLTGGDSAQRLGEYGPIGDGATVNMSRTPTLNTFYVGFNLEKVPKAVREAMAYVINREAFVEEVFKGRGKAAYHLVPPPLFPGGGEGYRNHWQS